MHIDIDLVTGRNVELLRPRARIKSIKDIEMFDFLDLRTIDRAKTVILRDGAVIRILKNRDGMIE